MYVNCAPRNAAAGADENCVDVLKCVLVVTCITTFQFTNDIELFLFFE